ncbi:MAG: amidase [Vicinamibacterales bacterium]
MRVILCSVVLLATVSCSTPAPTPPAAAAPAKFDLEEATVADLQKRMEAGQDTSRSIVDKYLARIEAIDKKGPTLRSVIELNPDATAIADQLDAERKAGKVRGPMHGIPVLIKDNIATADKMMTTAGSLALDGSIAPQDAFIVSQLRAAGAVILGKTNLSEWANIRSSHSSSGWSGRGGQVRNPYALDRNPCGSSSGSGAAGAANLAAVTIGTETDGSIVCPSSLNALVGIKPTIGLVSRSGIIPISHTQDTSGPMTRTVADAAVLLAAIAGADPADAVTKDSATKGARDYSASLDANGLKGARIGVVRKGVTGYSPATDRLFEAAIADLKRLGAEIVDPADIPTINDMGASELTVLLYELKADLNKYLAGLGAKAPVHTLEEVIAYNKAHADKEMPFFGQELFEQAQAKGPLTDKAYLDALARDTRLARKEGIDAVMDKLKLDALIAPTTGPAWLTDHVNGDSFGGSSTAMAAIAGYPDITVPAGNVSGLPVGLSFFGRAWSEPLLIKLAYAYEQGTKHRKPPTFQPTVQP